PALWARHDEVHDAARGHLSHPRRRRANAAPRCSERARSEVEPPVSRRPRRGAGPRPRPHYPALVVELGLVRGSVLPAPASLLHRASVDAGLRVLLPSLLRGGVGSGGDSAREARRCAARALQLLPSPLQLAVLPQGLSHLRVLVHVRADRARLPRAEATALGAGSGNAPRHRGVVSALPARALPPGARS